VAKPKPKAPEEGEAGPAATIIHMNKPKPKENFIVNLIDRQLEEDSLCSKVAQFFKQVNTCALFKVVFSWIKQLITP